MKVQSLVFSCDHEGCTAEHVPSTSDEVLAHLRLVEEGWSVATDNGYRRLHYCPEHKGEHRER